MVVAAAAAVTAWAASLLAVVLASRVLRHFTLLDLPRPGHEHTIPTPRAGGFGAVAGLLVVSASIPATGVARLEPLALCCLLALTAGAVGFVDDWRDLRVPGEAARLVAAVVMMVVITAAVMPGVPEEEIMAADYLFPFAYAASHTAVLANERGIPHEIGSFVGDGPERAKRPADPTRFARTAGLDLQGGAKLSWLSFLRGEPQRQPDQVVA